MQIDLSRIKTSADAEAAGLPYFRIDTPNVAYKAYKDKDGKRHIEGA